MSSVQIHHRTSGGSPARPVRRRGEPNPIDPPYPYPEEMGGSQDWAGSRSYGPAALVKVKRLPKGSAMVMSCEPQGMRWMPGREYL